MKWGLLCLLGAFACEVLFAERAVDKLSNLTLIVFCGFGILLFIGGLLIGKHIYGKQESENEV